MEKHVVLITALIIASCGIILGVLLLYSPRSLSLLSQAAEQKAPLCPINATLYVKELDAQGREIPLSVDNHAAIDVLSWHITDGQNPNAQPLYFNQLPVLHYRLTSKVLTFSSLPRTSDIYQKGDVTFLKLGYQSDLFRVVKKEIFTCSSPKDPNLCTSGMTYDSVDTATNDLDILNGISLDCNMTLEAGWVVQKILSTEARATSQAMAPPSLSDCDLNNDSACNTFDLFIVIDDYGKEGAKLTGDLNKDGKVNALDYTLLTSSISHL